MKSRMTIFAPTADQAKKELLSIAEECGATPKVLDVVPQGQGNNWLVSYAANPETVRSMEAWVS